VWRRVFPRVRSTCRHVSRVDGFPDHLAFFAGVCRGIFRVSPLLRAGPHVWHRGVFLRVVPPQKGGVWPGRVCRQFLCQVLLHVWLDPDLQKRVCGDFSGQCVFCWRHRRLLPCHTPRPRPCTLHSHSPVWAAHLPWGVEFVCCVFP